MSDGSAVESGDCWSTPSLSATDCAAFNKYKFAEWSELTVGTTGTQPIGAAFAVTMSINPAVYPFPSGVNKNHRAVYHTYTTTTGTTTTTVEEIIKTACVGANPTLPCIKGLTVSKTLIEVTFLTGHNGRAGCLGGSATRPAYAFAWSVRAARSERSRSLETRSPFARRSASASPNDSLASSEAPGGSRISARSTNASARSVGDSPLAEYRSPACERQGVLEPLFSEWIRARTERQSG